VIATQSTTIVTTAEGATFEYDTLCIHSFVEEDGELKLLRSKDFSDPEKRNAFHTEAAKLLVKRSS
jgi:hypothetical protein